MLQSVTIPIVLSLIGKPTIINNEKANTESRPTYGCRVPLRKCACTKPT